MLGLTSVIIGLLGKILYRPIIYSTDLNDFGMADSLQSLFYVMGFSLLLCINQVIKAYLIIALVTLGSVIFECYQCWQTGIFDLSDVVFSLIGGLLATALFFILERNLTRT